MTSSNGIDFNKLEERALWTYAGHHDIKNLLPNTRKEVLASACARHFNNWQVDEEAIYRTFTDARRSGSAGREIGEPMKFRKRTRQLGEASYMHTKSTAPAPLSPSGRVMLKAGEKVAAKVIPVSFTVAEIACAYLFLDCAPAIFNTRK
jgi:Sin3 binding region of histone deacetylase complex subunit SAP30